MAVAPLSPPPSSTGRVGRGCLVAVMVGLAVVFVIAVVYAAVVFLLGSTTVSKAIRTTCQQPDTVTYADGRYEVAVVEPTFSIGIGSPESYAVVGREGSQGSYGVYVEMSSVTEAEDVTCRWEADRVEIVEPNGIVHEIPDDVFMGGR